VIHRTVARRRGFTLVELLLVVALMAVLVALSTGAYFRIRASELVRATEATESKLNTLMDKRWTAIRDQADSDLKTGTPAVGAVLQFAGNDKDRARTIWTYLKFKNEFPTTVTEACSPVTLPTGFVVFQPRSVFTQQFGGAGTTGTNTPEESAAVFYLALTATGNRGETVGPDGTQQQTGDVSVSVTPPSGTQAVKTMRAYMDSWGNPIMFVRMASTDEVNNSPYVRTTGSANKDFLDPLGKLLTPSASWTAPPSTPSPTSMLDLFWAKVMQNHIKAGMGTLNLETSYSVPARNWVPTVISMGPNKKWDGFFDEDNIVSYRLRREGNRGD
jgi:prepilin-type N-terminal cleavage/methylation domain-containing protein